MDRKDKRHIERTVKLVLHYGVSHFHKNNETPSLWEELASDFPQLGVPFYICTDTDNPTSTYNWQRYFYLYEKTKIKIKIKQKI